MVSKEVQYTIQYYKPPEASTIISGDVDDDAQAYYRGIIKPGTLTINGTPVTDGAVYRICTTDELATGSYYTTLAEAAGKKPIDTLFWHAVAEYIYDQAVVTPKLDGRIKLEGGVPLPSPWVPGDRIKPVN